MDPNAELARSAREDLPAQYADALELADAGLPPAEVAALVGVDNHAGELLIAAAQLKLQELLAEPADPRPERLGGSRHVNP